MGNQGKQTWPSVLASVLMKWASSWSKWVSVKNIASKIHTHGFGCWFFHLWTVWLGANIKLLWSSILLSENGNKSNTHCRDLVWGLNESSKGQVYHRCLTSVSPCHHHHHAIHFGTISLSSRLSPAATSSEMAPLSPTSESGVPPLYVCVFIPITKLYFESHMCGTHAIGERSWLFYKTQINMVFF